MTKIEEMRLRADLSRKEMCSRFEIPYRTLQSWELKARECPPWAERLILKELKKIEEEKMKELYTADKETGTFIDKVSSVEEGLKLIEKYEESDKADGVYEEDFYDVVYGNHVSAL